MTENDIPIKPEGVREALNEMKIEENTSSGPAASIELGGEEPQDQKQPPPRDFKDSIPQFDGSRSPRPTRSSRSQTPTQMKSRSQTPQLKSESQSPTEVVDGDISTNHEPNKPAKLSRKATQKFIPREPPNFKDLEDSTEEATSKFQVIRDSIYGSKYMGSADHDALGCDCNEEFRDGVNHACGEDSDCINRLTKIECLDDECHCGANCQNQRFQKKQFAKVSVIKTEKKGFGLRADVDLNANDFIFEYIGEVINEPTFRRRTLQYEEEGIKHFYFMSLTKSEFVDATKKGNLGRFCNHSCNPNSYVDKWVVGDKLRMGIFAERFIKAGEELVFNYNVDRYGADPTPCYCGEPNCTGFLGGKTQTERATKLSHTTIEALGIDNIDGWDLAVAKKPRKKKTGEDDEEYVSNVQAKPLDHKGIAALMGTLMQCKEKWIVVKLLDRIIRAGDEKIYQKVVQFHGYTILKSAIGMWKEDNNVILQILDILYKLPRVSKNKIVDSKIEPSIQELTTSEHEDIASESKRLLEDWSKLELAYRIPRKKFDADAAAANLELMKKVDPEGYARMMNQFAPRRDTPVENKVSTPSTPNPIMKAPTGPRGTMPQRGPVRMVPPALKRPGPLPSGWYQAIDSIGRTYYYSKAGSVTWQRPTVAAYEAPAAKPSGLTKAQQDQKSLQAIIDSITKEEARPAPRDSPRPELQSPDAVRKKPEEKWRSLPLAKQQKIYETTLAPTVQYVMNRYTKKLPKEDLKRFAKDISKKMVASDYKRGRVDDPTCIDRTKEKQVKAFVSEFFDKAVKKRREHERKKKGKAERDKMEGVKDANGNTPADSNTPTDTPLPTPLNGNGHGDDEEEITMDISDDEDAADVTMRTGDSDDTDESRKRKYDAEHGVGEDTEAKRIKDMNGHVESPMDTPPPPPPPPPPPSGTGNTPQQMPQDLPPIEQEMQLLHDDLPPIELEMAMSLQGTPEEVKEGSEERELRAAQEALEKENEEAAAEEAKHPEMVEKAPVMEVAAQVENAQ